MTMNNGAPSYPVAIIGAGPVGLAAAAHLVNRGERPVVLEAGPTVGAHIVAWGHVQVFSPWRFNVDEVSAKLLRANGCAIPNRMCWRPGPSSCRNTSARPALFRSLRHTSR